MSPFHDKGIESMEYLREIIEFFLHIDAHLEPLLAQYGGWVYLIGRGSGESGRGRSFRSPGRIGPHQRTWWPT